MHTIQINDDIYKLPENWDDLSPKQLLYLVKLTKSDIPVEQVKIYMTLYCLKAHVCRHKEIFKEYVHIKIGQESETVRFKIRNHSYFLLPEEISKIADQLSFLIRVEDNRFNPSGKLYLINPELTTNPYPTIRCGLRKFTGPEDQLFDITFEQFMYMQTYLDAMQSDPNMINHLLACLWYRGKYFDINRIDKDAVILRRLPEARKMIMYWYIMGSLSCMAEAYPRVFSGEGKSNGRVFDAQLRLLDSLAQSDMTKKPEIRKGLLIDALYSMDESVRRQEETEEKFKNR
jgi:hypothetical protein